MKSVPLLLAPLAALAVLAGCAVGGGTAVTVTSEPVTLRCGQATVTATWVPDSDTLELRHDGKSRQLRSAISASGARFVDDREGVEFWSKGDSAVLTLGGEVLPLCLMPDAIAEPFVARGNEPFWQLQVEGGHMTLSSPDQPATRFSRNSQSRIQGRWVLEGSRGDNQLVAAIGDGPCRDSMSGMVYPRSVEVTTGDQTLLGCGGDPARLLAGAEWHVSRIEDQVMMAQGLVTLRFYTDTDGNRRIMGRAGCNRYSGNWRLTGEQLSLAPLASTRRACVPSLMEQEQRFLDLMANVVRFDLGKDGSLWLITADDRRIQARQ